MISLSAYRLLEDAWSGGVADWCRAATPFVLGGGHAWMVTVSDGQTNWIKQRLLSESISSFGVQFLDARSLRRELCLRAKLPPPALGVETLRFLLRLHALTTATPGSEWSAVARHPEACLTALDDFAAAGWLDELGLVDDMLPSTIGDWLPQLRATASWTPEVDRRLAEFFASALPIQGPLSICVFGWDAHAWSRFNLLTAAVRAAGSAYLYLPLPSGTSEPIQQAWLEACETAFGVERTDCDDSGFESVQGALADRLEGADLDASDTEVPEPELLTGVDSEDMVLLVRDYVARWLAEHPADDPSTAVGCNRLAILCPGRNGSSVALVRALTDAKIAVEDELGELPQPALSVQIQRAIIDYHLDHAALDSLLVIVELLNEHKAVWQDHGTPDLREVFPLDAVAVRRALHGAFADVQHHSVRLLSDDASFARTPVVMSVRRLIEHLGTWPEHLRWGEALARWQQTLVGLGLTTEVLEPLWSRLASLAVPEPVPTAAFFHYVGAILGGVPARRDPEASHRFARVVVTTLERAAGQTWNGVVLLDSNEGAWPLYPPENPFLGDATRTFLNTRRAEELDASEPGKLRGHLLTASDRAQLEYFHFLEILRNCHGPLAFAAASSDPADPNKELYPNEWLLRCMVETGRSAAEREGNLLDRWRRTIRQTRRTPPKLAKSECTHLREVWTGRRNPDAPFDEYFFNFITLTGPDALPWSEPWAAGQLDKAWNRPASFALEQIFGSQPWHDDDRNLTRGESWVVGRLVHRWLHVALEATREPRRVTSEDWSRALTRGLTRARAETEDSLRARLALADHAHAPSKSPALPLWWQGVMRKAVWATRRCLETLAETALRQGDTPVWLCMNHSFQAELGTASGPLRLRAQCDVVLLDQPELSGAICQLIDIRTGATSANTGPTASQLAQGKGLHAVATLLLAQAAGVDGDRSRAGTIHPDSSDLTLAASDVAPLAGPALERLAGQQRTLVFGQKGSLVDAHDRGQVETLPLATTPVEPSVLAAKARVTSL